MGRNEKKKVKSRRSREIGGGGAGMSSEIHELLNDAQETQPKKRSVQLRQAEDLLEDDISITNDDTIERENRKKVLEESHDKNSAAGATPSTASALPNLTNDEWEEHFSRCILLCNKNKVNVKNAFKLRIIDYMKLIFQNKSKKTENLALMGCTLDASAKIYAFRVDKVYEDVLKVVSGKEWEKDEDADGNLSETEKDKEPDDDNDFDDDDENKNKGKKKKTKHSDDLDDLDLEKYIIKDKRQIDKTENEKNEGESLIKDRSTLPDGLEYFLELPTNDDCELQMNGPIFPPPVERTKEKDEFINIGPRFDGGEVCLDPTLYLPQYKELHKSFYMIGEGDDNVDVDKALMFVDDVPKIIENVPLDMDEMREEPEYCGDYDDHLIGDDEPDEVSSLPMPSLQEQPPSIHISRQPSFSVQAMSHLVSASRNEYSFFDSSKVQFWKPPSHWSIKKKNFKKYEKKESKTLAKKVERISYKVALSDTSELKSALREKEGGKLASRTVRTWSKIDKMEPYDLEFSNRATISLFKNDQLLFCDKDYNYVGAIVDEIPDRDIQVPEIEPCERMEGVHEDDDGDDREEIFIPEEGPSSPLAVPLDVAPESVPDVTNELIEAPTKVAQISITYAKTQKKIDMKLLKTTMWKLLNLGPSEPPKEISERSSFSEVYRKLFTDLPKDEAKALSFPIAFMALLHLSNEKSLQLEKEENDDITVRLAQKPPRIS